MNIVAKQKVNATTLLAKNVTFFKCYAKEVVDINILNNKKTDLTITYVQLSHSTEKQSQSLRYF